MRSAFQLAGQHITLAQALQPSKEVYRKSLQVRQVREFEGFEGFWKRSTSPSRRCCCIPLKEVCCKSLQVRPRILCSFLHWIHQPGAGAAALQGGALQVARCAQGRIRNMGV